MICKFLSICLLITCFGFSTSHVTDSSGYKYYPKLKKHYKFHTETKNWFDAKSACRSENATLAMPANLQEMIVLKKLHSEQPKFQPNLFGGSTDYVIIGYHDMFKEGEHLALNGDSIQYFYHNWAQGQPDNWNEEDCGAMTRDGELNDVNCGYSGRFICEKGKTYYEAGDSLNCLSTDPAYVYSEETNNCYKLHLNPLVWSEARAICQAEGGFLAIIKSKAEQEFLTDMLANPHSKVNHVQFKEYALMGFQDIYRKRKYTNVLDEDIYDCGYVNWVHGKPGGAFEADSCGAMHVSGAITSFPCHSSNIFICQQPAISHEDHSINVRNGGEKEE